MKVLVTGGFGFIGSNLIMELAARGDEIVIIDNFSTGDRRFLSDRVIHKIKLYSIDLSKISIDELASYARGCRQIYHLAANADVRHGWQNTFRDIEQNILVSYKIAEVARLLNIPEIIFTSTGCVYGNVSIIPTPENHPMPIQTSLYGNSKVASEGIFSAYSAQGVFRTTVLRFVSVLGKNYHHGHIIDFVRSLINDPKSIHILGNGTQKKSYIDVSDCVKALVNIRGKSDFEVFNIGNNSYITVLDSLNIIKSQLGLNPKINKQNTEQGWIGDNPFTFLDISKAINYGWVPTIEIETAVTATVNWILKNNWVLSKKETRSLTKLH